MMITSKFSVVKGVISYQTENDRTNCFSVLLESIRTIFFFFFAASLSAGTDTPLEDRECN